MKRHGTMRPKVFGVGFQKTGTTSLQYALGMLGYRVTGPNFTTNRNLEDVVLKRALKLSRRYDAFQDNPWPLLYKEMDHHYPGSKFILTLRDPDEWIRSMVRHFGGKSTPMRQWIYRGYGDPLGNEDVYLAVFMDHNEQLRQYFRNRPDDLLTLKITEGEGWEVLCPFLGRSTPEHPFPHSNDAVQREKRRPSTVVNILKMAKRFKESF